MNESTTTTAPVNPSDTCECWDNIHHVAAGTLCERCQDEIGPEHYAATRRKATVDELVAERLQAPAPSFDATNYLLDAIEAVRCGQPGVATDIVDGPHFAAVKALLDDLDVPASPYGPGQHARLFRFLCDAAWGRDLPAREPDPLDPDDPEETIECDSPKSSSSTTVRGGSLTSSWPIGAISAPNSTTSGSKPRSPRKNGAPKTPAITNPTEDTTEPETCTTPHSGRYSASHRATSPAGTPRFSPVADAALAALSNAPNTTETNDEDARLEPETGAGQGDRRPTHDRTDTSGSDTRKWRQEYHAGGMGGSAGGASEGRGDRDHPGPGRPEYAPIGLLIEGIPIYEYNAYLDAFDPEESDTDVNQFLETQDLVGQVDQLPGYLPEYRRNSFDTKRASASTEVDPDETLDDIPINPEVTMIGMCPNCGGLTAADNKPIRCSRCAEWCCEDCAPYGTCLDCDKEKAKGQLINPDYHVIHPSPLDCADVLALRAFGLA